MIKMTVWALFDSGNGSYTKGVDALNSSGGANIDIYPVGIDIENKNNHFINLNLADYGRLFGDTKLFDELDKLPKPDIDNYEKALYDSMSGIVFQDDGQIALHTVGKFYSLNPRIEVEVEEYK